MAVESLRERYPHSAEAVRAFFAQYYGADVLQSDDAQDDLLLFHLGNTEKVVAVAADFLADFDPTEIRENLAAWNIAHLSRTLERGCRLMVTSEGPEEERDAS